jgi:hypothetical protein
MVIINYEWEMRLLPIGLYGFESQKKLQHFAILLPRSLCITTLIKITHVFEAVVFSFSISSIFSSSV